MSKPPFLVDVHLDQSIDSLCFSCFPGNKWVENHLEPNKTW
jgi:hypothetical protein